MNSFAIHLDETFPRLSKAPIVEVILEVRARGAAEWNEDVVSARLREVLKEFPDQRQIRDIVETPDAIRSINEAWAGVQAVSEGEQYVAQFRKDEFRFSGFKPYPGWEVFKREALGAWQVHTSLANPADLHRIGLRFINSVPLFGGALNLDDYLETAPKCPPGLGLPLSGFLHRESFDVPGYPYVLMITRTTRNIQEARALIIDVDVFTTQPVPNDKEIMENRLIEMRWLKNRAFFSTITDTLRENLR